MTNLQIVQQLYAAFRERDVRLVFPRHARHDESACRLVGPTKEDEFDRK